MADRIIYKKLLARVKEATAIELSLGILDWDRKVYMPDAGIKQRAYEISVLSKLAHQTFTSSITGDLLKESWKIDDLTEIERRNLEILQRNYDRETKLPDDFVEKFSHHIQHTEHLWEKAKKKSDFSIIRDDLQKMIELNNQKAHYIDPDKKPYDVLLDIYEPQITELQISTYFKTLKDGVLEIVDKCQSSTIEGDPSILKAKTDIETQRKISGWLIDFIGLDPSQSRLDEAEHPFTTGYGKDVRITTHYLEDDPMGSFYSVMHEAGHAKYEQGLPEEYLWTPIGDSVGLGVHESQSRFIENMIGKSDAFLSFMFPKLQNLVPAYRNLKYENFLKAVNAVIPSKIRIYADEVTYNLHIILRFELERDIFAGKIDIDDLPGIWNGKMLDYLNQDIKDDSKGVLQDTHWYGGAFGYFPDYALGNIYDGQLLHCMESDISDWKEQLREGNGTEILNWLDKNVHKKGFMHDPVELMLEVTGEKPDAKYFNDYLREKFSEIYNF